MSSHLLSRALGLLSPAAFQQFTTANLLHDLQPAPGIIFDGSRARLDSSAAKQQSRSPPPRDGRRGIYAHRAGVNSLAIDRFDGRYALSGGADAAIHLWDLEDGENTSHHCIRTPSGTVPKSTASHSFGITHLSFYPFDALAFFSSSYDHTLKIYASDSLQVSASFDLGAVVYAHATSTVATHLLVACATQHPAVRLVDLRSGASVQSLAGHAGAGLTVAWSPRDEHVLVSGGADGTVRFWDVRRSVGNLGMLDLEDTIGIWRDGGWAKGAGSGRQGQAHVGACNGVVWTDDGTFLVTTGHDERVRVWDAATGANTLVHFGPLIKNNHLSTSLPLLAPMDVTGPGKQVMFYPKEKELLMFDLLEGTLLKRLRPVDVNIAQQRDAAGQRAVKSRATTLAWRSGHLEMYSGHSDGILRAWAPKTQADVIIDAEEMEEAEGAQGGGQEDSRKRKRQVLDQLHRDLTKQKITFT